MNRRKTTRSVGANKKISITIRSTSMRESKGKFVAEEKEKEGKSLLSIEDNQTKEDDFKVVNQVEVK